MKKTAEQLDAENVKDKSECAYVRPLELDNLIAMDLVPQRIAMKLVLYHMKDFTKQ